MTIANTLRLIRSMGLTASYREREYRIDYRIQDPRFTRGDLGTSYYTEDQTDAIKTARYMAQQSTPTEQTQ